MLRTPFLWTRQKKPLPLAAVMSWTSRNRFERSSARRTSLRCNYLFASRLCVLIVFLATAVMGTSTADEHRDSSEMLQLLRPLTSSVRRSMAQVISGTRPVALATAVDSDGFLITKRSELSSDPLRVRLWDGRMYPARVAAVRRQNDLALLKIDSDVQLTPIEFENFMPAPASFLISPGRTGRAIGIGVLGARQRRIMAQGRLGVYLDDDNNGRALVREVIQGSGADRAGIVAGDVIVEINGAQQQSSSGVMRTLKRMFPGENVRLTVIRQNGDVGTDTLEMDARIREVDMLHESENDSLVNGPRSGRISGFDRVIQHDTVLNPDECGGPILDTAGRVVGMNIARAGRVVTYALPASLVNSELQGMLAEAKR